MCDSGFRPVALTPTYAMINPYLVFDLFCVCIDMGSKCVGGDLERVQIFS